MNISLRNVIHVLALVCLLLSGCGGGQPAAPTSTPAIVPAGSSTPAATHKPAASPTRTATPIPLPALTLKPGENYFSIDGKPGFIFSRNIAGYRQDHYDTFLEWAGEGGSRVARIQLDSWGMGYTKTGGVDEAWAAQWDRVFDSAQANGVYILPVFTGWFDWRTGEGYSTWKDNPLNQANGGPVKTPAELFQKDSATQVMWMNWMKTLVVRWRGRENILGWEIFSEVNLATGATESSGIDFVNTAAGVIRAADPNRPVTASLADDGRWPNFYRKTDIDFINLHPYWVTLDRLIVTEVRKSLTRYNRPVLIGESGISGLPDSNTVKADVVEKTHIGLRHAIWAAVVSGAMNGRALYWEDSFGIYFTGVGSPWMEKFKTEELPAAKFTSRVDFTGFQPLNSTFTSGIWGAAVGNEKMVLGWYRDAACEPPDWNLKPVISKQTVTITVPGNAADWRVDIYDTETGIDVIYTIPVTRKGKTITIALPDFTDQIAFKLYALP